MEVLIRSVIIFLGDHKWPDVIGGLSGNGGVEKISDDISWCSQVACSYNFALNGLSYLSGLNFVNKKRQ